MVRSELKKEKEFYVKGELVQRYSPRTRIYVGLVWSPLIGKDSFQQVFVTGSLEEAENRVREYIERNPTGLGYSIYVVKYEKVYVKVRQP